MLLLLFLISQINICYIRLYDTAGSQTLKTYTFTEYTFVKKFYRKE